MSARCARPACPPWALGGAASAWMTLRERRRCALRRRSSANGPGVRLRAQSTVEYAIVTAAFAAMIIALGAMWRLMAHGEIAAHAVAAAARCVIASPAGFLSDVFLF